MTIKRVAMAIALASLMGIILPVASAQAPPCFTFADGHTQAFQCPAFFRPEPVQYSNAQSGLSQATDNGDRLPGGFFDQRTIDTLRQNAAQNQSQNATAAPNQTAQPTTKLTSSDIEAIRNSLNTTRESLEHNDTQAAIESINRVDGALFAIIQEEPKGPVRDRLTNLSDTIDASRQSVFSLDNERTLEGLNVADSQLLLITEMLPTPTPTPTSTPTATEEEESEPQIFPFGYPEIPLNQNQTNTTQSQPQPEPQANQTNAAPLSELDQFRENLRQRQEREQNQTNATTIFPSPNATSIFVDTTEAAPTPPQVQAPQQQEPAIKIPLNKTQHEIITIEEIGNINKTTHEKTTISIIEGNKTTHRDVTTTEVPL